MRVVIQRVDSASVSVDNKVVSAVNKGLLIFVGIHKDDTQKHSDYLIKKILNLRLFDADNKFASKSLKDLDLEILLVSQFTLYADCKKGSRPSFDKAMPPRDAKVFYQNFINKFKNEYPKIKNGIFGAYMKVSLINDGPVTIILDSC